MEGAPLCDSRVMHILSNIAYIKHTRRENISIRDLSIKDITDRAYDRQCLYCGESNRPGFVYKKKKKDNNF